MLLFIKGNDLLLLKKKYILLYVLNLTDILFTLLLLQTGYFTEMNLFMVYAVEHPLICILLKIIFPALLLEYIYHTSKTGDDEQLRVSNIAVNISLLIYTLVNLSHLVWTSMLPYLIFRHI